MEDLFGVFLAIIAFAISAASKSKKRQQKSAAASAFKADSAQQNKSPWDVELKAAAPAAAAKQVTEKKAAAKETVAAAEEYHQHEGRQDMLCPAEEERPSQRRVENLPEVSIPGLKLTFDRNTVLQGFVMSEILNRPRPGMRR